MTPNLDYFEQPAHLWPKQLDALRRDGHQRLGTKILWGVHERTLRIRDFARSSSRDLEKFLALVKVREMGLELRLGFPAHRKTFPQWVFSLERSSLVPGVLWDATQEGFFLSPVPSLRESTLIDGYLEFLEEVLNVVAPYCVSKGPVRRIMFDFGLFGVNVSLLDDTEFISLLRGRYPDIGSLNRVYGTTLKNFGVLETKQGIRLLIDRRPWMAAFDYRWCRAQELLKLWQRIWKLGAEKRLTCFFVSSLNASRRVRSEETPWRVAFDGVHIDSVGEGHFPFLPEGLVNETSLKVFRMWEYLHSCTSKRNIPVHLLPLWEGGMRFSARALVVICGNYLSRASQLCLEHYLESGGHVVFPFGLPKYDEQMKCYDWLENGRPIRTRGDGFSLVRLVKGNGIVWIASPPVPFDESMWKQIEKFGDWVSKVNNDD